MCVCVQRAGAETQAEQTSPAASHGLRTVQHLPHTRKRRHLHHLQRHSPQRRPTRTLEPNTNVQVVSVLPPRHHKTQQTIALSLSRAHPGGAAGRGTGLCGPPRSPSRQNPLHPPPLPHPTPGVKVRHSRPGFRGDAHRQHQRVRKRRWPFNYRLVYTLQ